MFIRLDEGTAFDTDRASAREIEALSEAYLRLEDRCDELEQLNERLEERCGEEAEDEVSHADILRMFEEDLERSRDILVARIKDAIRNHDDAARAAITNAVVDFNWETNRTLRALRSELSGAQG
jgi:hypothetical protein